MEKENKSLWMLKGIACIVVILFHCPISGIVGDAIIYAVRFPIPVFLMISGYYGFRKKNYLKYAKKTLLLIITGEVISAIVMEVCFKLGLLKINPFQILANINWIKTIFFGSIFNSTLWYLYAAFWRWILLYLLEKFSHGLQMLKYCIIPLLIMHIAGRMLVMKYGNIQNQIFWFRSTILFVIPFLMIGMLIAEHTVRIKEENFGWIPIMLILVGLILIVVEYIIWHQYMDLQVSTVFVSVGLFMFAIRNPNYMENDILVYIGHISQYIYLLHMPIIIILKLLLEKIVPDCMYLLPWVVIIVTIMVSAVYEKSIKLCSNMFGKNFINHK